MFYLARLLKHVAWLVACCVCMPPYALHALFTCEWLPLHVQRVTGLLDRSNDALPYAVVASSSLALCALLPLLLRLS